MKTNTQILTRNIHFVRIRPENFGDIAHYMSLSDSLTCDYTFGGIALWTTYFDYRFAIIDNTLYISGGREDDLSVRAFAMPVGDSSFAEQMHFLRKCSDGNLWLSAVPEDRLHLFAAEPDAEISELGPEWSDYLYDIHAIASLEGGAMKKKRNHVNRFTSEFSDARLVDFSPSLLPGCRKLLETVGSDNTPTGVAEYEAVSTMLADWNLYAPYLCGAALVCNDEVIGFTAGEIKGETLHVHIEKCNHTVAGANEALTSLYASEMLRRSPRLLYVNRQDDAGDPGLRASKESWRPLRLLPKFNVSL